MSADIASMNKVSLVYVTFCSKSEPIKITLTGPLGGTV
jgi:hypothetical protein